MNGKTRGAAVPFGCLIDGVGQAFVVVGQFGLWGWLFLGAATLPALSPKVPLGDYQHRQWGMVHGLPHASVRGVAQTPDGYLWVATEYGLARFNGEQFTAFTPYNTPALVRPFLNCLAVSAGGVLWLGGEGGGLVGLEKARFLPVTTNEGMDSVAVRALAPARDGSLWVAGERGVYRLTNGVVEPVPLGNLPPMTVVFSVAEDAAGGLWVGTDRGLYGTAAPHFPAVRRVGGTSALTVRKLLAGADGQLWVGTDAGLWVVRTTDQPLQAVEVQGLRDRRVRALHRDKAGTLWVGTGTGLQRRASRGWVQEAEIPALHNVSVFAFLEDQESNLWIGAGNGLHCLTDRVFATVSARDGLVDEEVQAIIETGTNRFLMGTLRGTLYEMEQGVVRRASLPEHHSMITTLLQGRSGGLWIGSRQEGLTWVRDGGVRRYQTNEGLWSNNLFCLVEDGQGAVWAGTGGGLNVFRQGRWEKVSLPVPEGKTQPAVRSLLAARNGALWVGTQGGLYRLDAEGTNYHGRAEGFPADQVYHIAEDAGQRLWLGTSHGLICRWEGQWRVFKRSASHETYHVYWLAHDERGFVWYATPWSIFRVETARLRGYWGGKLPAPAPVMFTQADGLLAMECLGGRQPAGCHTSDGRLVFLTRRGLAISDLRGEHPTARSPRLVIERIRANGMERPVEPALELPAGTRVVEFKFACLSYRSPEKVRYGYRLLGVDDDWVAADHRRVATYANMRPGQYEFRVTADDGQGLWQEAGVAVQLRIKPYFYQTAWFYGGAVMLAGIGVYGGHRLRLRRLEKINRRLASLLDQRTRELEQALVARLRLEQEALARKQQEMVGQIAAGIAHHLNNQLQAIQSSAALLQEESAHDPSGEQARHLACVESAVSKSARVIEQLLSFGQRHWMRKSEVDVNQLAREVAREFFAGRVRCDLAEGLPVVQADAAILRQSLQAVLKNAMEASPADRPIILRTCERQFTAEELAAEASFVHRRVGRFVEIAVVDEGPGMSAQALAHLFEPFFTTKDVGQGTGMGLAAAFGGLRQNNGWMEAGNHPEGGCVIRFYLPVAASGGG